MMDVLFMVLRFLGNAFLVWCVIVASVRIDTYLRDRRMRRKRLKMYEQLERELKQRTESET